MTCRPLVGPGVDLRDFAFVPIYRARLFGSAFHAKANDAEWRAGMTLWLKSWDQRPAGSLPTDDVELCRLAEFGRDMDAWLSVKSRALHNWVECSDGRLYHPVVAEVVNTAWVRKRKASIKGMAGAAAKWRDHKSQKLNDKNASAMAQAMPAPMPNDGKGQGQGQGQGDSSVTNVTGKANGHDLLKTMFDAGVELLTKTGTPARQARSLVGKWRKQLGDDGKLMALIVGARNAVEPVAYVTAALKRGQKSKPAAASRQEAEAIYAARG
jgi:hypothetical protein